MAVFAVARSAAGQALRVDGKRIPRDERAGAVDGPRAAAAPRTHRSRSSAGRGVTSGSGDGVSRFGMVESDKVILRLDPHDRHAPAWSQVSVAVARFALVGQDAHAAVAAAEQDAGRAMPLGPVGADGGGRAAKEVSPPDDGADFVVGPDVDARLVWLPSSSMTVMSRSQPRSRLSELLVCLTYPLSMNLPSRVGDADRRKRPATAA